jgi:hypothetical protein
MVEIWKQCQFDNRYYISNEGNIKRLMCDGKYKNLKKSVLNKGKSHPYYYIQVQKGGKRKNCLIHRLVGLAFIKNDYPDKYKMIDHIDRDTFNNEVKNLRWCDQNINMKNTSKYRDDIPIENHRILLQREFTKKVKKSKKYNCELCNIQCVSPYNLKNHNNSHSHKLRLKCREEIKNLYNPRNFLIWRNNRYKGHKKMSYVQSIL